MVCWPGRGKTKGAASPFRRKFYRSLPSCGRNYRSAAPSGYSSYWLLKDIQGGPFHPGEATTPARTEREGDQGYAQKSSNVSRRFNRQGRNTLWQTDLKYGPYLSDPSHPGHKLRTYLIAIIDDATRHGGAG